MTTNKKGAPATATPSNTNKCNHTFCRCASQLHFAGFPPPPKPGEGKLSDFLDSRSGWHEAIRAASHLRRAAEIETAWREMGGAL